MLSYDESCDKSGMKALIESWPDQLERSFSAGLEAGQKQPADSPRTLLWAGMGGSAIGGDLIASMLVSEAGFPVLVHRGGHLPAWVGEQDRALLVSYSGNTAETLDAAEQLTGRGTELDLLTSGGTLAQWAQEHDLTPLTVPGGRPPRAALGDLFGSALGLVTGRGWLKLETSVVNDTISALRDITAHCAETPDKPEHPLHDALELMRGKLPMVYGTGSLVAAAHRWATQINENSKLPAHWGELPEMNHNEVVAYTPGTEHAQRSAIMLLVDPESPEDVLKRVEITRELAESAGFAADIFAQEGGSKLMRLLAAVCVGDWLSYWMAVETGTDPTPIPTIDRLKAALAG